MHDSKETGISMQRVLNTERGVKEDNESVIRGRK